VQHTQYEKQVGHDAIGGDAGRAANNPLASSCESSLSSAFRKGARPDDTSLDLFVDRNGCPRFSELMQSQISSRSAIAARDHSSLKTCSRSQLSSCAKPHASWRSMPRPLGAECRAAGRPAPPAPWRENQASYSAELLISSKGRAASRAVRVKRMRTASDIVRPRSNLTHAAPLAPSISAQAWRLR